MLARSLFACPRRMMICQRAKSTPQTRNWQHSEMRIPVP
jgi:hypothetical protein